MITRYKTVKTSQPLPGVARRVLAHSPSLMLVEHILEKGALLPQHKHPHEQAVYLISGQMTMEIDGVEHQVTPGDSFVVPPDVPHKAVALERSVALDIFTPARADFL
jgi:quercetin dioxygenase-like cupin family protein